MQINDLPQGTPTPSDVVPFNTNGLDYKATMEDITELVEVSEKPVTFTSDDEETPTAYKTMATLASGALNTLMGILSKAVSNVRFLYSKLTELTTQVNTNTDDIATLNSKFIYRSINIGTVSIAAGQRLSVTYPCDYAGYTPFGIVGIYVSSTEVFSINRFSISGNNISVTFENSYTSERSSPVYVMVMYEKQ